MREWYTNRRREDVSTSRIAEPAPDAIQRAQGVRGASPSSRLAKETARDLRSCVQRSERLRGDVEARVRYGSGAVFEAADALRPLIFSNRTRQRSHYRERL